MIHDWRRGKRLEKLLGKFVAEKKQKRLRGRVDRREELPTKKKYDFWHEIDIQKSSNPSKVKNIS